MTTELQRAKARYEEARIAYKRAVLASLNGDAGGDAIRESIRTFQDASSELRRITGTTPQLARPVPPQIVARRTPARAANDNADEASAFGFRLVRRLLSAG